MLTKTAYLLQAVCNSYFLTIIIQLFSGAMQYVGLHSKLDNCKHRLYSAIIWRNSALTFWKVKGHLSVEFRSIFLIDQSPYDAENFVKFEKIVEKLSTAIDDLKSSHAQVLNRLEKMRTIPVDQRKDAIYNHRFTTISAYIMFNFKEVAKVTPVSTAENMSNSNNQT